MKHYLTVFFVILTSQLLGQSDPRIFQLDSIVTDSSTESYYPKLLERFEKCDTTLTDDEMYLVYYGFATQPGYSGYRDDPTVEYNELNQAGKHKKLYKACKKELEKTPVCIASNIYFMISGEKLYPNDDEYKKYKWRAGKLLDVLFESGDGESEMTAYQVLFLSDEKRILYGHLGLDGYSKQALVSGCFDVLTVKKSDKYDKKELYFNVYLPMSAMTKVLQAARKKDE